MVAPKGPGHLLRERVPGRRRRAGAVRRRAATRPAPPARASSPTPGRSAATRAGVLETTFAEETETDLFGEQAVLCGGRLGARQDGVRDARRGRLPARARVLRDDARAEADRRPACTAAASTSCASASATPPSTATTSSGPRIIDERVRETMKDVLADIQDGSFANRWIAENEAGRDEFERLRRPTATTRSSRSARSCGPRWRSSTRSSSRPARPRRPAGTARPRGRPS